MEYGFFIDKKTVKRYSLCLNEKKIFCSDQKRRKLWFLCGNSYYC